MFQTIEEYNEQIRKLKSERNAKIKEELQIHIKNFETRSKEKIGTYSHKALSKLQKLPKKIKSIVNRFTNSIKNIFNRSKDKVITIKKERINEVILAANIEFIKQQIEELRNIIIFNNRLLNSKEIRSSKKRHQLKELNKYLKEQIKILSNELNLLINGKVEISKPTINTRFALFRKNIVYRHSSNKNKVATISKYKKEQLINYIAIKYLIQQNEILKEIQKKYETILLNKKNSKKAKYTTEVRDILNNVKNNLQQNEQNIEEKKNYKEVSLKERFKTGIIDKVSNTINKVGTFSRKKVAEAKKKIAEINEKVQESKKNVEFKIQKAEYHVLETKDRFKKGITDTIHTTKEKVGTFARSTKEKFKNKMTSIAINYQENKITNLENKSSTIRQKIEQLQQYKQQLLEQQQLQPVKAGMSRGTVYVWFTLLISGLLLGFLLLLSGNMIK